MAKKTPRVGRPAKTPGAAKPPVIPSATSGTIRERAGADEPWNPTGKVTPAPKPKPPGAKSGKAADGTRG